MFYTNAVASSESPIFEIKPTFFHEVLRNTTRSKEECVWLLKGIPKPPSGYRFSHQQIEDQMDFFKFKKESHVLPSNLVDCYRYTIIAVCKRHLWTRLKTVFDVFLSSSARGMLSWIASIHRSIVHYTRRNKIEYWESPYTPRSMAKSDYYVRPGRSCHMVSGTCQTFFLNRYSLLSKNIFVLNWK